MPLLSRAAKKQVSWLRRTIYSWHLSCISAAISSGFPNEILTYHAFRMDGDYKSIPLDIDLVEAGDVFLPLWR